MSARHHKVASRWRQRRCCCLRTSSDGARLTTIEICRHEHSHARRLCRCDRTRADVDRLDLRLLVIDAEAFNYGSTPQFAAISAVQLRRNDISNAPSTAPDRFRPMQRREVDGDFDPSTWCQGSMPRRRSSCRCGRGAGRWQRQSGPAVVHAAHSCDIEPSRAPHAVAGPSGQSRPDVDFQCRSAAHADHRLTW